MLTVAWLNSGGFAEGEITNYATLEWTESVGPSGWAMTGDADLAALLADSAGIVITEHATGRSWSGHVVTTTDKNGVDGSITGNSDLCLLASIVPHPDPVNLTIGTVTHDVLTGTAGGVIADLIDRNAGVNAHPTRRRGLTVVTENVAGTPATTIRARWTPHLLEWVLRKAVPNGVTVEVLADDNAGGRTVTVRGARTLDDVFAAELLSMSEWQIDRVRPSATAVYAGGSGEGIGRVIRTGERADVFRRETFLDRRSVTDDDELDQEIVEALESNRRKTSFTATLVDRDGFRYGTDFLLGDFVRVWLDDVELIEPVTEVRSKMTAAGLERQITVGFGPVDSRLRGQIEARQTAARLDDIEGEI